MRNYKQLSQAQRYQIEILHKQEKPKRDSGAAGRVARNDLSGVEAEQRQERVSSKAGADKGGQTQAGGCKSPFVTDEVILVIEEKICLDWSPEQVSGWLKINQGIFISHERIYQPIREGKRYGGTLYTHLRQSNKKRKNGYQLNAGQFKVKPFVVSLSNHERLNHSP